jgi:hypothetical protein
MKNLKIIVEADVNDGDYITSTTSLEGYSKEEITDIYNKLISLKGNHVYEKTPWEQREEIDDFMPWIDNQDVHSITDVELIKMERVNIKDI